MYIVCLLLYCIMDYGNKYFPIPALCRVSQRMLKYENLSSEDLAIVKLLLENCIKLLKDDSNSQVFVSWGSG